MGTRIGCSWYCMEKKVNTKESILTARDTSCVVLNAAVKLPEIEV